MDFSFFLVSGIIGAATVIAVLSAMIIKRLNDHGETAMARLKLNKESTVKEFKYLLLFHSLVLPAMALVTIAGVTENQLYINLGRGLVGIQGIGIAAVFLRWWRHF